MKLERTRNAGKGIAWGLVERIVVILFTFILRSVMVKTIGQDYLGLSSLFTSILQILNLSELGFSSAVIYSLYKPVAEEDYETIGGILNFYKKVYMVIGLIVMVFGIALFPMLPNLIKGQIPDDMNLIVLYLIYLSGSVLSYWLFAYKSAILYAYQKNAVVSKINTAVHVVIYILQAMGLIFLRDYYAYVILLPVSYIIVNISTAIAANKLLPSTYFASKIDRATIHDIVERVKGLFIAKLCVVTRNTLDSVFISAFLGLGLLAIYDNYYRIIFGIFTVFSIVLNSIRPGIGNSLVTEAKEKNYEDFHKFIFLYSWLSGASMICLVCLLQPFMYLWMGSEMMFNNYYVALFGIYFYVLTMGDIRTVYFDAAGLWWYGIRYALAESALNIILNWVLVKHFGVSGVMAATIISVLLVNFLFSSRLVYKYYFTEYNVREFFLWHVKYLVINLIVCIPTIALCHFLLNKYSILTLLLRLVVAVVVPNFLLIVIYWRQKERKYINQILSLFCRITERLF